MKLTENKKRKKKEREREKKRDCERDCVRQLKNRTNKSYGVYAGTKTKTMTEILLSRLLINKDHALYTTAKAKNRKKKKKSKSKKKKKRENTAHQWFSGTVEKHSCFLDKTATGSRCVSLSLTNLVLMVYIYISYISVRLIDSRWYMFVRFLAIYARVSTVCAHTYTHTHTHTN